MSTMSTPLESRPLTSALCRASPLGRLSRPTAIAPLVPFSARNVAYAPATAVATSGVRSLPVTPRMSYSRKIARESAIELARLKRDISTYNGSATLRERNDGIRKQSEHQNDDNRGPHHGAG